VKLLNELAIIAVYASPLAVLVMAARWFDDQVKMRALNR
jgi:hypothetical protein